MQALTVIVPPVRPPGDVVLLLGRRWVDDEDENKDDDEEQGRRSHLDPVAGAAWGRRGLRRHTTHVKHLPTHILITMHGVCKRFYTF